MPFAAQQGSIRIDGVDYAISVDPETGLPRRIEFNPQPPFPPVQAIAAQFGSDQYGLNQRFILKSPLGMGQDTGSDPSRCFTQQNVNTFFSTFARGPQKQTVTLPSGTVAYNRIQNAFGEAWAMEREPGNALSTKTMTKFYFHAAADDRSISGLPTSIGGTPFPNEQIMNATIGTTQASNTEQLSTNTHAHLRFLSAPLAAQSIGSQNWTLQIARKSDNITGGESFWGCRLFVFNPSQREVVGYIIGSSSAIVEYGSTSENTTVDTEQSFQDSAFSGSAVAAQQGDVLVFEMYSRADYGSPNTIFYYDGTTEQSTDNTTVSNHASFIQSASNITISADAPAQQAKPLVYFQASTPEWIDSTIASDTGLNFCQGVVNASERVIALSAYPFGSTGGQGAVFLAWSWDKTTWSTSGGPTIQNNQFFVGIAVVGTTVNVLFANDHSFPTKWHIATINDPPTSITIAKTVSANSFPHAIVSFPDSAGVETAWVAGHDAIYIEDARLEATRFSDPTSNFTGQMIRCFVGDHDSLVWSDGRRLYAGSWGGAGSFDVVELTSRHLKDGLPTTQQGRITSIHCTTERGWVGTAVGGEDGSHNASVLVLDENGFHCPYYNGTANRVIRAIGFSREDDGKSRLLMMEDNGSAGDVAAFMFDDITENPALDSAYKLTNALGVIEDSDRDEGFGGLINKIFLSTQLDADDLSSNEKVGIEHAHNGGSFNTLQNITSSTSPARVYTDGSGTAVGTKAKRQRVRYSLAGTLGATTGPNVKSFANTYAVPPEKPDGAVSLEFAIPIMLKESDFKDQKGLSQRMTDINALLTGTLKTLRIGQTDVKVLFRTYQRFGEPKPPGVTANTQPELPGELVLIAYEPGE